MLDWQSLKTADLRLGVDIDFCFTGIECMCRQFRRDFGAPPTACIISPDLFDSTRLRELQRMFDTCASLDMPRYFPFVELKLPEKNLVIVTDGESAVRWNPRKDD